MDLQLPVPVHHLCHSEMIFLSTSLLQIPMSSSTAQGQQSSATSMPRSARMSLGVSNPNHK